MFLKIIFSLLFILPFVEFGLSICCYEDLGNGFSGWSNSSAKISRNAFGGNGTTCDPNDLMAATCPPNDVYCIFLTYRLYNRSSKSCKSYFF
jgi:hypothetical protein